MPTTRLQAKSGQPPDLVSSPGAHPPRRSHRLRQGNVVVTRNTEDGTPSSEVANGDCGAHVITVDLVEIQDV